MNRVINFTLDEGMRHIDCRWRCENRSSEAFANQPREVATVVEMRVGQNDCIDRARIDGEEVPIQLAQLPHSQEEPAIDKQPATVVLNKILGASDCARSAKACESQQRTSSTAATSCDTVNGFSSTGVPGN